MLLFIWISRACSAGLVRACSLYVYTTISMFSPHLAEEGKFSFVSFCRIDIFATQLVERQSGRRKKETFKVFFLLLFFSPVGQKLKFLKKVEIADTRVFAFRGFLTRKLVKKYWGGIERTTWNGFDVWNEKSSGQSLRSIPILIGRELYLRSKPVVFELL